MSTVNTEGKLNWYLGIELSLRSLGAYLQLGFSLGAVQLRHACVPYHLAAYSATCLWRRKVTHTPEDGVLYLDCPPEEENKQHTNSTHTIAAATAKQQRDTKKRNGGAVETPAAIMTRPVSAQTSGPVDPHAFLAELLAKFDALAAITHGEAADVRLLVRMTRQDLLVQAHRTCQAAAGIHPNSTNSSTVDRPHASEENVVFRLSESDATYAALTTAGLPTAITYRDFVNLTTLLSEAVAWDMLWIHTALDQEAAAAATGATPPASIDPAASSLHRIEADCVAVMLPNSVEYNAIWMAAARSGPLHTFLDVLYRNSNHITGSGCRGGTYRPCRTALLNTNLASNAMLYHAIECAGSVMLVMDPAYVPLLFCPANDSTEPTVAEVVEVEKNAPLKLNVPPHVKRIYLWRTKSGKGESLMKGVTPEMESMLADFNAAAYQYGKQKLSMDEKAQNTVHDGHSAAATSVPPPPPPLDLYESVKVFYERAQATPAFTVRELRHTYLISSPKARFLVHRILRQPPLAWKSLLALNQHPANANTTPITGIQRNKTPAVVMPAIAAESQRSRAQLDHYKAKMAAILSVLLRRFHHTQPVLFIYTSGTTGLPKAARFSHLRFFATGFLSRVLYYRERIAETVVEQLQEAEYVREHPDAVWRCAAVNATISGAAHDETMTGKTTLKDAAQYGTFTAPENANSGNNNGISVSDDRCPPIPQLFGAKPLNSTRRRRTTVEATVVIICNVVLWWVRYFASFCGLDYYVQAAAEHVWYTPDERTAVEAERRLVTIYNCLPMYHTVGSVFCLGHLLHALEEQQYAWAQVCRCSSASTHLAATVPTVRMVLRSKFSASQFRKDLQRYHVTVVQYIGEVLRYAVLYERSHAPTAAVAPAEGATAAALPAVSEAVALAAANRTSWRVPYAFGNGLRQDIWLECMRRLNVAHPVEFYSSTEGNIFLLNLFGMPGVVGHIPRFPGPLAWLSMQYFPIFPFRVLRFDEAAQQVYRDPATGYCAHCAVGDVGEVVGEVIEGFDMFALRRFDGYHKANTTGTGATHSHGIAPKTALPLTKAPTGDQEEDVVARQSKVIRHVLWPYTNDCYFLSGDLIRMDSYGFCTFVDRVGDTFRWKGENVSTLEVSNALNSIHTRRVGVREAVVYGVQLPRREGRAGMAMLSLQPSHVQPDADTSSSSSRAVTLAEERRFLQCDLYAFLTGRVQRNGDGSANQATLPAYAIPLFVRMQDADPQAEKNDEEGEERGEDTATTTTAATSALSSPSPSDAAKRATEDSTQTTTFKYKRGVLIKQGYDFDGSSTTVDGITAWGGVSEQSGEAATTSYTRVYVLVTNPGVFKALAVQSEDEGGESRALPAVTAGYVPLTKEARQLLGENLEKCGW